MDQHGSMLAEPDEKIATDNQSPNDNQTSATQTFEESKIKFNLDTKESFPRSKTHKCILSVKNETKDDIIIEYQELRLPDGVMLQQYDDIARLRDAKFSKLKEVSVLIKNLRKLVFGKVDFPLVVRLSRQHGKMLSLLRPAKSRAIGPEDIQSAQHLRRVVEALGIDCSAQQVDVEAHRKKESNEVLKNQSCTLKKQICVLKKEIDGLEEDLKASAQVVLEPDEQHQRELVLICERSHTNPTSYTIACEIKVISVNDARASWGQKKSPDQSYEEHVRNIFADKFLVIQKICSKQISVAPSSVVLGLISAFSALVGIVLYYSQYTNSLPWFTPSPDQHTMARFGLHIVSAFFLGFFLLQIFDYVENFTTISIAHKLKEFLNWRTAMFIGLIAGLLTLRLIEVLAAIVGGGAVAAAASNRGPPRGVNLDETR